MLPLIAAVGSAVIESYHAANAGRTRVPDWVRGKRKENGTVPLHLQIDGFLPVCQCSLLEAINCFIRVRQSMASCLWVSAKPRLVWAVAVYRASQQRKQLAFGGIRDSEQGALNGIAGCLRT